METTTIYAIYDNVAKTITGGLHLHKHQASAIRFYSDVALTKDTNVNRHTEDYDLVQLGHLKDNSALQSDYKVILTGKTWLAAQNEALKTENEEIKQQNLRPMGVR